ncbi:MAG: hypothetical protein IJW06_01605 [Clostridia bacterium]|nr:hypothetical protein [Clostridia bacterium]
MSDEKHIYKETVERYCNVLGRNMKFNQYMNGNSKCFECSNRDECEKNGGCRHHVFSEFNVRR